MEAIRCEGLTKRYGKFVALDRLDLGIDEGVVFGFLGPNGAGKTTTVKMLTGISRPAQGRAWVAGQEVDSNSNAFRAKFGYLPEEPAFYTWMTGREFLLHVAQLFGLSAKAAGKRADELLELAGLQEARRRRVGGYSRGMRQRLGLAQALVNQPPVLFLDEPCSALDPIGRRDVLELIQSLRGQVTVFMSTHILADVERVCDRVGIVDHGRLIAHDSVTELRERYARPAFELQFAEHAEPFAQTLKTIPWIAKVEAGEENGSLRVLAGDAAKARHELPSVVAASGLTLLRYEVVSPTLEDVFVDLVDHRNHTGENAPPRDSDDIPSRHSGPSAEGRNPGPRDRHSGESQGDDADPRHSGESRNPGHVEGPIRGLDPGFRRGDEGNPRHSGESQGDDAGPRHSGESRNPETSNERDHPRGDAR